jgi:hypothetical protein
VHIIIQFLLLGFNVKAEQVASLEVITEEAILSRTMYKLVKYQLKRKRNGNVTQLTAFYPCEMAAKKYAYSHVHVKIESLCFG